jgi:hypothetical protein
MNNYSFDGFGAQMQRQVSICAISHKLGMNFLHSPIKDIEIQPSDCIESYANYLEQANTLFDFSFFEKAISFDCEISHVQLGFRQIIFRTFQSWLFRRSMLIRVYEIKELVDANPLIVREIAPLLLAKADLDNVESKECILHYRQGVGNFAIYPGQSIPREVKLEDYIQILQQLMHRVDFSGTVTVLTDAPSSSYLYKPSSYHTVNWEQMPTYHEGSILIHSQSFEPLLQIGGLIPEIRRGGNPVECFKLMLKCKILLISRSSFSYLPALLNLNAEVYYPKNFWHTALRDWKIF